MQGFSSAVNSAMPHRLWPKAPPQSSAARGPPYCGSCPTSGQARVSFGGSVHTGSAVGLLFWVSLLPLPAFPSIADAFLTFRKSLYSVECLMFDKCRMPVLTCLGLLTTVVSQRWVRIGKAFPQSWLGEGFSPMWHLWCVPRYD